MKINNANLLNYNNYKKLSEKSYKQNRIVFKMNETTIIKRTSVNPYVYANDKTCFENNLKMLIKYEKEIRE